MNDREKYMKVGEALQAILDPHAINMFHCAFNSEPYKALEAPVTEIATITLKNGADKDTLEELVEELSRAVSISPPESGAVSAAWGPSVEKDDVFFLIIGWTSVDVSGLGFSCLRLRRGNQPVEFVLPIGPPRVGQCVAGDH